MYVWGLNITQLPIGFLSLLFRGFICLCMLSVSLCSHWYKRHGCQMELSPHRVLLNFTWQDMRKEGHFFIHFVIMDFCFTSPKTNQGHACATNDHKGELCKMIGWLCVCLCENNVMRNVIYLKFGLQINLSASELHVKTSVINVISTLDLRHFLKCKKRSNTIGPATVMGQC